MLNWTAIPLASLKGRVVVPDFWETWCAPCVAEIPALAPVYGRFESNRDGAFLGVNSEWKDDTADKIRSFIRNRHLSVPVALDTSNAANELDATSLPSLILNRQERPHSVREIWLRRS
jgi:thiol-disulfide isomerase/thioredoxin